MKRSPIRTRAPIRTPAWSSASRADHRVLGDRDVAQHPRPRPEPHPRADHHEGPDRGALADLGARVDHRGRMHARRRAPAGGRTPGSPRPARSAAAARGSRPPARAPASPPRATGSPPAPGPGRARSAKAGCIASAIWSGAAAAGSAAPATARSRATHGLGAERRGEFGQADHGRPPGGRRGADRYSGCAQPCAAGKVTPGGLQRLEHLGVAAVDVEAALQRAGVVDEHRAVDEMHRDRPRRGSPSARTSPRARRRSSPPDRRPAPRAADTRAPAAPRPGRSRSRRPARDLREQLALRRVVKIDRELVGEHELHPAERIGVARVLLDAEREVARA